MEELCGLLQSVPNIPYLPGQTEENHELRNQYCWFLGSELRMRLPELGVASVQPPVKFGDTWYRKW